MSATTFQRTAVVLSLAIMGSMLGLGMMVPALPSLSEVLHITPVQTGAMLSSFGFARMAANAPAGYAVDRWGTGRAAAAGLCLIALGGLAGGATVTYWGIVLAFVLQGLGAAAFSTGALTALLLAAGPARRGQAMAWFQTAVLLSFAVGPVIGGAVVGRFGPHAPFWVTLGMTALSAAALPFMVRSAAWPSADAPATQARRPDMSILSLLRLQLVITAGVAFTAFFCRVGFAWQVVPQAAVSVLNLPAERIGLMLGAGTLANLLIMPVIGRSIDGWGGRPVLILSAGLSTVGLAIPALIPSEAGLWLATVIVMIGTGALVPAASAMALTGSHPSQTGRIMGLFRTISDSGMALGPLMIPLVAGVLSLSGEDVTLVAAGVGACGFALALLARRQQPATLREGTGGAAV